MKLESFENEIDRLESQLLNAIAATQALKEIQAIFRDIEPWYEDIKRLTDDATGLEARYVEQIKINHQQVERIDRLEEQLSEYGAEWKATIMRHQQEQIEIRQQINRRTQAALFLGLLALLAILWISVGPLVR